MLTGKRAFEGDDVSDTLAAEIGHEIAKATVLSSTLAKYNLALAVPQAVQVPAVSAKKTSNSQ